MDQRAASAVFGMALMLAIVGLLAGPVVYVGLGLTGDIPTPGPQASMTVAEYSPDGEGNGGTPYLVIEHQAGDVADGANVYVVDDDGNRVAWANVSSSGPDISSGSSAHIDGCGSDSALNRITETGQVYRIVFESPDGETLSVSEVTVPSQPDPDPC